MVKRLHAWAKIYLACITEGQPLPILARARRSSPAPLSAVAQQRTPAPAWRQAAKSCTSRCGAVTVMQDVIQHDRPVCPL